MRRAAKRHGIEHRVIHHGFVPRRKALEAIAGADLAVVITSVRDEMSPYERGIITGKFFEPIGLGTQVLLIAPEGSDIDAIAAQTGLASRFSGRDVEGMKKHLEHRMSSGIGTPPRHPELFAWTRLGDDLDTILRDALASPRRTS